MAASVGADVEYVVTTQWSRRADYRYSKCGALTDNVIVGPFAVQALARY